MQAQEKLRVPPLELLRMEGQEGGRERDNSKQGHEEDISFPELSAGSSAETSTGGYCAKPVWDSLGF